MILENASKILEIASKQRFWLFVLDVTNIQKSAILKQGFLNFSLLKKVLSNFI